MFDFLDSVVYWHWFVGGLILVIAELFFPTSFLLWEGLAALSVGAILYFVPLSVGNQFLLFALVAPILTILGRHFMSRRSTAAPDHRLLNQRTQQLIGHVFRLDQDLDLETAHLSVGGSMWKVVGPDLPAGTQVIITHIEGNTLHVKEHPKKS